MCHLCHKPLVERDTTSRNLVPVKVVIFNCNHVYHADCVLNGEVFLFKNVPCANHALENNLGIRTTDDHDASILRDNETCFQCVECKYLQPQIIKSLNIPSGVKDASPFFLNLFWAIFQ